MQLTKTVLELRFQEPAKTFNWRETLVQKITGKPIQSAETSLQFLPSEVIELDFSDHKAYLIIESNRFLVSVNEDCASEELDEFICSLVARVADTIDWKVVTRIGLRTIWRKSFDGSFDDLIRILKEKNYKPSALLEDSKDIAISLTFEDKGNRINYNSGSMTKLEITQRYGVSAEKLPEVMLVADVDYVAQNPRPFEANEVISFYTQAVAFAKEKARLTEEINL